MYEGFDGGRGWGAAKKLWKTLYSMLRNEPESESKLFTGNMSKDNHSLMIHTFVIFATIEFPTTCIAIRP